MCIISIFFINIFVGSREKHLTEKVLLTAFETVKDASSKCSQASGDEATVMSNSNLFHNGDNIKSETPHVKKRHRRMKSSGIKNSEYDGKVLLEHLILYIIMHYNHIFIF